MNPQKTSTTKRVIIHNDLDVIVARLRAREVAREIGFSTIDQARISLAAGELARILARDIEDEGEIVISGINTQGQLGIQVVGINSKVVRQKAEAGPEKIGEETGLNGSMDAISGATALVDEYQVEDKGKDGTCVTLMKWLE